MTHYMVLVEVEDCINDIIWKNKEINIIQK